MLIDAVREQARREDCAQLVLDTGLGNALAQEQVKFLEQQVTDLSARVQTTRAALLFLACSQTC